MLVPCLKTVDNHARSRGNKCPLGLTYQLRPLLIQLFPGTDMLSGGLGLGDPHQPPSSIGHLQPVEVYVCLLCLSPLHVKNCYTV